MLHEYEAIRDYSYLLPALKPLYEVVDEATYTILLLDPRQRTGLFEWFPDTQFIKNLEKLQIKDCKCDCCISKQHSHMLNVFEYGCAAAVALRAVLELPKRKRDCRNLMQRIKRVIPRIYTVRDAVSALYELEEKTNKRAAKSKEHEHAVNLLYTIDTHLKLIVTVLHAFNNKDAIYDAILATYKECSGEEWSKALSNRLYIATERGKSNACTAFDSILLCVKYKLFDAIIKPHQEDSSDSPKDEG